MTPPAPPRGRLALTLVFSTWLWAPSLAAETTAPSTPPSLTQSDVPADSRLDPLELTDEIRAFLDAKVSRDVSRLSRLHGLMGALFDPDDGLGITYGTSGTRTAAGTFDVASGNCLSFTLLFVSMARYLGLEAHFVEVGDVVGWSQEGPTSFGHWHIYVEVEIDNGLTLVDFLPVQERRYFRRRRIDEARVRAHFHNNLGAEILVAGDVERAIAHLETALHLDPTFIPASVNLGVARRRAGDQQLAEVIFRRILAEDPRNSQAATNLAALLRDQGRTSEAKPLLDQVESYLQRNPFHHFRLAMTAYDRGDFEAAHEHLVNALRRRATEALFHEKMADVQLHLDLPRKAVSSLERALELTEDADQKRDLEARLRRWRAGDFPSERTTP